MNFHESWRNKRGLDATADIAVRLPFAKSQEKQRLRAYLLLIVADGIMLVLSFAIADLIYTGKFAGSGSLLIAQLVLPIYWTAALALKAYSLDALVSASFRRAHVVLSLGATATLVSFVAFMLKSSALLSRGTTIIGFLLAVVLVVFGRWAVSPLIRRMCGPTASNILVIDDGGDPVRVAHAFHVDARMHGLQPDLGDPHMLDRIGLYMMNMDRVIVSCPRARRAAWAMVFKSANVQGEIFDRDVIELGVLGANRGYQMGSLVVSAGPLGMRSRAMKRMLDLVLAMIALIVLLPVLLATAIAILIEDGRPIFFVQQRMGRGNTFIPVIKFRSMRVERSDSRGDVSTARDDNRVTRVGRVIRKLSIDELPQLFNVIAGHMSRGIGKIAVMQMEPLVLDVRILVDFLDPAGVER